MIIKSMGIAIIFYSNILHYNSSMTNIIIVNVMIIYYTEVQVYKPTYIS